VSKQQKLAFMPAFSLGWCMKLNPMRNNLIFSYSENSDMEYKMQGHTFLGSGLDHAQQEVHVFLRLETIPAFRTTLFSHLKNDEFFTLIGGQDDKIWQKQSENVAQCGKVMAYFPDSYPVEKVVSNKPKTIVINT
jgi:hypothetical protein